MRTTSILPLLLFIGFSCKPVDPQQTGERVMLWANQSAVLASGITVFVDAIADYRCPPDMNCISGGSASVQVRLKKGEVVPAAFTLSLGVRNQRYNGTLVTDSVAAAFDGRLYKVVLRNVARERASDLPLAVIQVAQL